MEGLQPGKEKAELKIKLKDCINTDYNFLIYRANTKLERKREQPRINLLASDVVAFTFGEAWKCFCASKHRAARPHERFTLLCVSSEKSFSRLGRVQSGKLKNTFTHVN